MARCRSPQIKAPLGVSLRSPEVRRIGILLRAGHPQPGDRQHQLLCRDGGGVADQRTRPGLHRQGVPSLPVATGDVRHSHRNGALPGSVAPWCGQTDGGVPRRPVTGHPADLLHHPAVRRILLRAGRSHRAGHIRVRQGRGRRGGDLGQWPRRCSSSAWAWPS